MYSWLFKTRSKNAQDSRIKTILEIEAFEDIHEGWKRVGYPFNTLVPSYATAIGSSADRPAALAELVGVILNDGIRYPIGANRTRAVRREYPVRDGSDPDDGGAGEGHAFRDRFSAP